MRQCYINPNADNEAEKYILVIDSQRYELKIGFQKDETVLKWYKQRGYSAFSMIPKSFKKCTEPVEIRGYKIIRRKK